MRWNGRSSRPAPRKPRRDLLALGNTRIEKRLPLIKAPTMLIWGEQDRIMPRSYAARIASALAGPTETRIIPRAGHLAELDQPDAVAGAILSWVG
ncbi:alpha/beta fold hydrolase [Siccirubricoccus deserti]